MCVLIWVNAVWIRDDWKGLRLHCTIVYLYVNQFACIQTLFQLCFLILSKCAHAERIRIVWYPWRNSHVYPFDLYGVLIARAVFRFEKLDITPKSAQKIKPVLERWMKEAEERYTLTIILDARTASIMFLPCFFLLLHETVIGTATRPARII